MAVWSSKSVRSGNKARIGVKGTLQSYIRVSSKFIPETAVKQTDNFPVNNGRPLLKLQLKEKRQF